MSGPDGKVIAKLGEEEYRKNPRSLTDAFVEAVASQMERELLPPRLDLNFKSWPPIPPYRMARGRDGLFTIDSKTGKLFPARPLYPFESDSGNPVYPLSNEELEMFRQAIGQSISEYELTLVESTRSKHRPIN